MEITRLAFVTLLVYAALAAACTGNEPAQPIGADMSSEAHAMAKWQALDAEISKLGVFIESRLDFMSSRRATLTDDERKNFDAAKSAFDEMDSEWRKAKADFVAGDVSGAVKKGDAALLRAQIALRAVGTPSF